MIFSLDLITGVISFLFTILIFSYLLGDNPLFRIASYIFVGVSAGYVAAISFKEGDGLPGQCPRSSRGDRHGGGGGVVPSPLPRGS